MYKSKSKLDEHLDLNNLEKLKKLKTEHKSDKSLDNKIKFDKSGNANITVKYYCDLKNPFSKYTLDEEENPYLNIYNYLKFG